MTTRFPPDAPLIRQPCTCAPHAGPCPACTAWDRLAALESKLSALRAHLPVEERRMTEYETWLTTGIRGQPRVLARRALVAQRQKVRRAQATLAAAEEEMGVLSGQLYRLVEEQQPSPWETPQHE